MKDIFISKSAIDYPLSGVIAGIWAIDSLPVGALAIFNQDGSIISNSATLSNIVASDITGNNISISEKTLDDTSKNSIKIDRRNFTYSKRAYEAPVAPIKVLGSEAAAAAGTYSLNLPASISVGDVAGVVVTDNSRPFDQVTRTKEYSITIVNGDTLTGTGASNIITKLAAVINADPLAVVTAVVHNDGAGNNDGIKFTGKTVGKDFNLSNFFGILDTSDIVEYKVVNGVYTSGAVTTVVAYNIGHGVASQIRELETDLSTRDGRHVGRVLENEMWKAQSNVDLTKTYVSYILNFTPVTDAPNQRDPNYPQILNIFVPVENEYIGSELTSGTVVSGSTYEIIEYKASDDFTNIGGTNVTGTVFVATGTTPTTWTNSSKVHQVDATRTEYALDKILPLI